MSNDKQTDLEKAQGLLPWFAKNSLSPDDSKWVEAQLTQSDQLKDELKLIKKQIQFTKDHVNSLETEEFENKSTRLNALQNRIKYHQSKEDRLMDIENKGSEKNTLWQKIKSLLPKTQKQWQITGAFALSIMVIQGVVISQLINKPIEYSSLSADKVGGNSDQIIFLTAFEKDITVNQLELFLKKNQLTIIDGPDLDKQYRLKLGNTNLGNNLSEEEVNELVFSLVDKNKVIDFIFRE